MTVFKTADDSVRFAPNMVEMLLDEYKRLVIARAYLELILDSYEEEASYKTADITKSIGKIFYEDPDFGEIKDGGTNA